MTHDVIILYGSRARGDARPDADVDLLLASTGSRPQQPVERCGVSLHRYPREWLLQQASVGDLFAYHVGHEGVPLQDADGFLLDLRLAFRRRASYLNDARIGLMVARLLSEIDWGSNLSLRRRFFWGVKTFLISAAAEEGEPVFGAASLENKYGIDGLRQALNAREGASLQECRALYKKIDQAFPELVKPELSGLLLRSYLEACGGYAASCARATERHIWEEEADTWVYA